MCCGKNRTGISQTTSSTVSRAVQSPPAFLMGQRSSTAYFEYTGKTAMTAMGPLSGRTYRFVSPGCRLEVDLRDCRHLAAVPNLVRIKSL